MNPRSDFLGNVYLLGLKYNGSVTSWFRSDKHNKAVGGVAYSGHRFGLAVDFVFDIPLTPAQSTTFTEDARRLGIRVIPESDHMHLQPLDWSAG